VAGAPTPRCWAPLIPDAAAHFVIASVLGAPAAILISLIMVPETSDKRTGSVSACLRSQKPTASSPPAPWTRIVKGTAAGLELLLNIIAMLLVLVALVYLARCDPSGCCPRSAAQRLSLQRLLAT